MLRDSKAMVLAGAPTPRFRESGSKTTKTRRQTHKPRGALKTQGGKHSASPGTHWPKCRDDCAFRSAPGQAALESPSRPPRPRCPKTHQPWQDTSAGLDRTARRGQAGRCGAPTPSPGQDAMSSPFPVTAHQSPNYGASAARH